MVFKDLDGYGEKRGRRVTGVESNSFVLLKKKRREEKRREERRKEKVKVEVEVEERISAVSEEKTGNSRAWQFPDSSVTYPIARPRANPTQIRLGHNPEMLPPAGPSSHPALTPRHLQDPIKY